MPEKDMHLYISGFAHDNNKNAPVNEQQQDQLHRIATLISLISTCYQREMCIGVNMEPQEVLLALGCQLGSQAATWTNKH